MATLNLQVGAVDDNAHEADDGSNYFEDYCWIIDSTTASSRFNAAFVWDSVTIANGATITTASIQLYNSSGTGDDVNAIIYGNDVDSANNFTVEADVTSRTTTTANDDWTAVDIGTSWETSDDCASCVKEIVDRASWSSGNSLCLIVKGKNANLGDGATFSTYGSHSSVAAKLDIDYSTGTAHTKTVAEAVAIADTIQKAFAKGALSESVSISDSLSRVWAAQRTLTETVSIADSLSRVWAAQRVLTESVSMADHLSTTFIKLLTVSESISISDSLSHVWTAKRTLTESVGVTDSLSHVWTAYKTLTDSVSFSDSVITAAGFVRSLSEDLSIVDSLSRVWAAKRTLDESLSIADSLTMQKTIVRILSESISFADSVIPVFQYNRILSESVSLSFDIKLIGTLGRLARGQFKEITEDDVSNTFSGHWR